MIRISNHHATWCCIRKGTDLKLVKLFFIHTNAMKMVLLKWMMTFENPSVHLHTRSGHTEIKINHPVIAKASLPSPPLSKTTHIL